MILVSPTAFKGTLSVRAVAQAMEAGAAAVVDRDAIRTIPLSDGGNGLLSTMEAAGGGKGRAQRVPGPLGTSVTARYLVQPPRAVVETAEACGLHLVPTTLRDPMRASTRGVGELLLAAADALAAADGRNAVDGRDAGVEAGLVMGLGGSATVDAGAGMVQSLGWKLLDRDGDPIPPGGRGLLELHAIEPPEEPLVLPELVVLADVQNPLLGEHGAAPVFGPQKGAAPDDIPVLERGLEQWARAVARDLERDVAEIAGGGAAGGLGAAFAGILNVAPRPGAQWLLEQVGFDAQLEEADVVITGEGAWDEQSAMGKVTAEVVARARDRGVPVLLVVGSLDGPAPDGVTVVSGEGEALDAKAIERRVAEELPALL